MISPFPPALIFWELFFTELFFGFTYDRAVNWFGKKHGLLFKFLVSWSVVIGTSCTLVIRALFLWNHTFVEWQSLLIDLFCFVGSGVPMIIGSMVRGAKPSHKARKAPPNVRRTLEDISAEMLSTAGDVNEQAQAGQVGAAILIRIVHQLHRWEGILRTL